MFDEENDEPMEKLHSVILLCLGNEVLCEVAKEDTIAKLWLKLKRLYDKVSYKSLVFKGVVIYSIDERRYVLKTTLMSLINYHGFEEYCPYVSAIGSIMYVMVCTKLDNSNVVNVANSCGSP